MLAAFERIKRRADKSAARTSRRSRGSPKSKPGRWRSLRFKEFKRHFGKVLGTRFTCGRCGGPIAERMTTCPWCGKSHAVFKGATRFPATCLHCKRGMKLDWRFCPHEYGAAQGPRSSRSYADRRYEATCANPACRGPLMPFLKYCPWCRTKIRRKWKIAGIRDKCPRCGWGVVGEFWRYCPWCGRQLAPRVVRAAP
jgi:hypothetical protein